MESHAQTGTAGENDAPPLRRLFILYLGALEDLFEPERAEDVLQEWCEAANSDVSGKAFVTILARNSLRVEDAQRLIDALMTLGEGALPLAVRLVTMGAFSRNELMEPQRIVAYFGRGDWSEIVTVWATSNRREIRHAVRRRDKPPAPEFSACPAPRAPLGDTTVHTDDERRRAIKATLPRRLRDQGANCFTMLKILQREPTVAWSIRRIAGAVERERRSCGVTFPIHTARECIAALASRNYVTNVGDGTYRHRPGTM